MTIPDLWSIPTNLEDLTQTDLDNLFRYAKKCMNKAQLELFNIQEKRIAAEVAILETWENEREAKWGKWIEQLFSQPCWYCNGQLSLDPQRQSTNRDVYTKCRNCNNEGHYSIGQRCIYEQDEKKRRDATAYVRYVLHVPAKIKPHTRWEEIIVPEETYPR